MSDDISERDALWLRNLVKSGRIQAEVAEGVTGIDMAAYDDTTIQSEATLLNHVIASPACRIEAFNQVRATDFTDRKAQQAWERMEDAWNRDLDLSSPDMRKMWIVQYKELQGAIDRSRSWQEVIRSVVDASLRRRIGNALDSAAVAHAKPDASIAEIRESFEQIIVASMDDRMWVKPPTVREALRMYLNRSAALMDGSLVPVPLGIPALDAFFSVFPGDMVIIGARPRVGKTAFVLSVIRFLCEQGIPVGLICIEMSYEDIIMRLISQVSGVPGQWLRKQVELTAHDRHREAAAMKKINGWPLHLCCGKAMSAGEIHRTTETWAREDGIKAVFIDYLTLITSPRGGNQQKRYELVGETCVGIKRMGQKLNIPTFLLAQIGRQGANMMPRLEHLRETGSIEQDADAILLIDRPDVDEPEPGKRSYAEVQHTGREDGGEMVPADMTGRAAVIIAKQRNGDTGYRLIPFHGPTMRFYDGDQ